MSKVNFFQQAPVQDTYQKRFLEAVLHKRHLIASFPLTFPVVTVYALAATMSEGLAVIVCPDSVQIQKNLDYFRQAGLSFPDVAFLDGTQMPHEERSIHKEINHHRVRVLYVTPERFTSLTFLEILVHQPITFLAVEEADRLLDGSLGYQKFYEQGLRQLHTLPPMALLVPPMAPHRLQMLVSRLQLPEYQLLQSPPLIEPIEIKVKRLFSEHQKFTGLIRFLSGSSADGKVGRLDTPGSVLIQTAFPAQAEKLGAALRDYGFDAVGVTHFKKSQKEQAQVQELANTKPHFIWVNAGVDVRNWMSPAGAEPKLIYWSPPESLDSLWTDVFRQPHKQAEFHPIRVRIYYTREDYLLALQRLKSEQLLERPGCSEKLNALKLYRTWVLDESCRLQYAAGYLQGRLPNTLPPCGRCDRCLEVHDVRWKLQHFLQPWIY